MVVDYHYFAVVAPVDAVSQLGECHTEERMSLYTGAPHLTEEPPACRERTNMVKKNPYLHTVARIIHKYGSYLMAQGIIRKYIILKIDGMLCVTQVAF